MTQRPKPPGANTDVPEFVTDLEAGVFEAALSVALSETAAAVVDHDKKGEINVKLKFEQIKGTHQVRIEHTVKYQRPTQFGRRAEEFSGATVMHVGKGGKLTLTQERLDLGDTQLKFPDNR